MNSIEPLQISYLKATLHYMKSIVDIGMLSMPWAYQNTVRLLAFAISVILLALIMHGLNIMFTAKLRVCELCNVEYLPMSSALGEAFKVGPLRFQKYAKNAAFFVDFILSIYYLSMASAQIALIAEIIGQFMNYYFIDVQWDTVFYTYFELVPLLVFLLIRNFRLFIPFYIAAILILNISLIGIFYYTFTMSKFHYVEGNTNQLISSVQFIGIVLFTCCPIGVIFNLESDMVNEFEFFTKGIIINVCIFLSYAISWIMGGIGLMYGDNIAPSIILNLPMEDIGSQILKLSHVLAFYFMNPMYMYSIVELIWHGYLNRTNGVNSLLYETLIRMLVMFTSVSVAAIFGNVGLLLAFFGCFIIPWLIWTLPSLIDILLPNPSSIHDILFIILGLFISFVGSLLTYLGKWF